MKRFSLLVVSLVVCLALPFVSCDLFNSLTPSATPTATATPTPTPTPTPTATPSTEPTPNIISVNASINNSTILDSCFGFVTLSDDSTEITDGVTVQINGLDCTYDGTFWGGWVVEIDENHIAAGTECTLTVTGTNIDLMATITMPEMPILTAPATATYDPAQDLIVSWSEFTTDPNMLSIDVDDAYTVGDAYSAQVTDFSTNSTTIPAGTFTEGQAGVTLQVSSMNMVLITDDGAVDSSIVAMDGPVSSQAFNIQ